MTTLVAVSPSELMREHLMVLREYARQVLVGGEALGSRTEGDCKRRMAEFLAIGRSFHLTDKELVCLVYRGLITAKSQCGCSSCRARAQANQAQTLPDEAAS